MISLLIPIFSVIGAGLTVWLCHISPLWLLLLFPAYLAGLSALFFLFAILASVPVKKTVPPSPERRPQRPLYRKILLEAYTFAIRFMRVHVRVTGLDRLPEPGQPFLLVSNHLSNYDHMIILTKLHRYPLAFVSKPENFRIPVIGKYLQESAFLPIDRENPMNAVRTIRSVSGAMADGTLSYGIFPEGTRSKTGELLPFHDSIFYAARRANVPVVVVHMTGSRRVHKRGPWLPTRIHMDVLACLDKDFVHTNRDSDISDAVRRMMLESEETHRTK